MAFIKIKPIEELFFNQGRSAGQSESIEITRPVSEQQDTSELSETEAMSEKGNYQTSNQLQEDVNEQVQVCKFPSVTNFIFWICQSTARIIKQCC